MKYSYYLLALVVLLFLQPAADAQQVQIRSGEVTSNNDQSTFNLDHISFQLSGNQISLSNDNSTINLLRSGLFGVSDSNRYLAAFQGEGIPRATVVDGRGNKIKDSELDYFDSSDETLKIRIFDDGRFITRDNVANFSFFDANGRMIYSVSNTSGSEDGELQSELSSDPSGNTILLYNPEIVYQNQRGSRARFVHGENDLTELYSSRNRTISHSNVTGNGSFASIVTTSGDGNDDVWVYDRFGNELAHLETDMELRGAQLSENAGHLTIYSSNRAQAYRLSDMERQGSASFNAGLIYAFYSAEDNQILAISGQVNPQNNHISDAQFHSVHLTERSIAREDITYPLSYLDIEQVRIKRSGTNQFHVKGLNRELIVETVF